MKKAIEFAVWLRQNCQMDGAQYYPAYTYKGQLYEVDTPGQMEALYKVFLKETKK